MIRDRGASMVEMAILAPLLILLATGVIEIGRMMAYQIDLHEAAQEGALFATFQPDDNLAVRNRVVETTDNLPLSVGDVTVTCPGTDRVRVTVDWDFPLVTGVLLAPVIGDPVTMQASVEGEIHTTMGCDPSP